MARSLSLSLSKAYLTTTANIRSTAVLRSLSTVPPNHDLAGDESSGTATDPLVRKLEDVIHRIMVRRSAPDWLPFLPGHSYWVPPPRSASGSLGIAQLLEKLANPLSDEESLSTTTVRGWPSSDYFIKDAPLHMDKGDVNITPTKAETATNHDNVSQSEENDG